LLPVRCKANIASLIAVCLLQTAQKSGKRSLAAAALTNRLRSVTAPEGMS